MVSDYETVYSVGLLDDIHNFFPAILYHPTRFTTVQDLMQYTQEQMNYHFNIFNRARRAYHAEHGLALNPPMMTTIPPPLVRLHGTGPTPTPAHRPRVAVDLTTETIDLTHLFTTGGGLGARMPGGDLEEFTVGLDTTGGGILDQLTALLTRAAEPVVVAPTTQQIERATTIRVLYSTEEDDDTHACSICQEPFMDREIIRPLREIIHCAHTFHQTCIDRWFTRNVRCPVCRFDIREHVTPDTSPE